MIYIETGTQDVYTNFALEYYFAAEKQLAEPVFLFWRTAPTLMIGKYQNTYEEIDRAYAEKRGIDVVRRMSGGGTIYTDPGGWQFSFIRRGDQEAIDFHAFIAPVTDALHALGVPAEFTGRNDLVIDGRKFSGNAQYKFRDTTVHHGSLLFSTQIEEMVRSTTVDPHKILSKSIKSVRDRVTNISDHLRRPMTADAFKTHMVSYIMGEHQGEYFPDASDRERIEEIAQTKFRSWEARYGADPKFRLVNTGRFAGGKFHVRLDAKHGIITDAMITGDFFGNEEAEQIARRIVGAKLDEADLRSHLSAHGSDRAIYGITGDDIIHTILHVQEQTG